MGQSYGRSGLKWVLSLLSFTFRVEMCIPNCWTCWWLSALTWHLLKIARYFSQPKTLSLLIFPFLPQGQSACNDWSIWRYNCLVFLLQQERTFQIQSFPWNNQWLLLSLCVVHILSLLNTTSLSIIIRRALSNKPNLLHACIIVSDSNS